jgi:hypothetical protein
MKNNMTLLTALGVFSAGGCIARPTAQPIAYAPRADVQITSSPNTPVLIYSTAPSQFALRGEVLRLRSDTIRATTPIQLETYLDAGEIHVAASDAVPISVEAAIAHSPASRATATGLHIVIESGGTGIRSVR